MIPQLTNHLWQSTFFAVAAGLLTLALRGNRAQVRFWLWLSASLKFFLPFSFLLELGSRIHLSPAAQTIATPAIAFTVETISQPFSTLSVPAAPVATHADWTPYILAAFWLCGFTAVALTRLRDWLRIRAALRASTPLPITSAVNLRSAPGLLEPGVVGLLRPTLLLPEGIATQLTPSQLEAVLAHELCHIRRRDNLFASLHMLAEAIFWFHPLVWWIGARLVEERERACDEEVLSQGNQPVIYADAILNVCKLYLESPLTCVSGVTGADIKQRIEAIMTNRIGQRLNSAKKLLLSTAGLAALVGPVAVGLIATAGKLPILHAQSRQAAPMIAEPVPAPVLMAQSARPADTPAPVTASIMRYQDNRLVAMLFDLSTMSTDQISVARQAATSFVSTQLNTGDLATVITATDGKLSVAQDFTGNIELLKSTIQGIIPSTTTAASYGADRQLATLDSVATMLGHFPQKKTLIYFSSGKQWSAENQPGLQQTVDSFKKANIAIFPIDTRLSAAIPALDPSGRLAEAQAKFGNTTSQMAKTYIRYGAPDQIEDRTSGSQPAQIWRYNHLDDFHGNAELEFSGRNMGMKINWPPLPTVRGVPGMPAADGEQLNQVLQEGKGPTGSASLIAGLPGKPASLQVYPALGGNSHYIPITIPIDTLSGKIDIIAALKTRPADPASPAAIRGSLRDNLTIPTPSPTATYGSGFTVPPGSYVIEFLVKEQSTGRTFAESINFDVE